MSGITLANTRPLTWGFEAGLSKKVSSNLMASLGLGYKEWLSLEGIPPSTLALEAIRVPELRAGANLGLLRTRSFITGLSGSLALLFPGQANSLSSSWGHSESLLVYGEGTRGSLVLRGGVGVSNSSFSETPLFIQQQSFTIQIGVRYFFSKEKGDVE